MQLTNSEIVFLKSLQDWELQKLLSSYPKTDQTLILTQLMQSQSPTKPDAPDNKTGDRADDAGTQARAKHARKTRLALQDIAPLPDPMTAEELQVRNACNDSLLFHLQTCYPNAFQLPFSDDHLRLIDQIEIACRDGQLKALAMPRGNGKTTIVTRAGLWSLLAGYRKFAVVIAATEAFAQKLLSSIKTEILTNQMLQTLYRNELHCLKALEGESKRAIGQRFEGQKTNVQWLSGQIAFGYVPTVNTSGAILSCCGITGNIRGQQITGIDGVIHRPDLVLVDDPQTKESASSPSQCQKRHELMMGDVLGMAGPHTSLSALCTCTVIYKNDLADRLLDRKQSPVWQGDICKMVYDWPKDEKIWDEYRTVWEDELRRDGDGSDARQFVQDHFDQMHLGSKVGWKHRYRPDEVSALQHAYNLRFRDEAAFYAEYQNDPLSSQTDSPFELDAETIARKTNNEKRGVVPAECERITTFVDVQNNVLFYVQTAWEMQGRGHVINYGTYPDQGRLYFTKKQIEKTLQDVGRTENLNEAIYLGLDALMNDLFARTYRRADGTLMGLDRCGVDARSGYHTRCVRRFCRETKHMGRIHPQFGVYIGKDGRPWHQWKHNKTHRMGVHCRMQPPPKTEMGVRELMVDTNWWKSFAAERLAATMGADKTLMLWDDAPARHRMFAEHCLSETPVRVVGKAGNEVIEWRQETQHLNNDFWDCLVGTCVLASVEGVRVDMQDEAIRKQKPKRNRRSATNFVGI